jgi:hypothetical protein
MQPSVPGIQQKVSRQMRLALNLLLLVAFVAVISCGHKTKRLNVVMIAIDTLRPDHLGCYGYGRSTSPRIDRLAADGALFENAVSQAPWTLPSFGTVFTSLYPTQHGATVVDTRMRTSFPTLASILAEEGFAVAAVVNAPVLRPEFGLNRGFEHYDVMPPGVERNAGRTTEDALKWLDGREKDRFFLFVHYFDPHMSYSPPVPYDTLFDPDYGGRIGSSFNLDYFSSTDIAGMRREIESLSSADMHHIEALYDGEIGLLSDHGEEFLDHGGLDHGHSLYNELTHVALIFRLPGLIRPGTRVTHYVRLLDVTPSILDMLGISPGAGFEGVSRKSLLAGRERPASAPGQLLPPGICYSEALRRSNTTRSIIAAPWKLIYDTTSGAKMLFNLAELMLMEQTLFRCKVGMTDTWYVKMVAGGEAHTFDATISPPPEIDVRDIHLCEFFDRNGNYIRAEDVPNVAVSGLELKVRNLHFAGELTLAFQTERKLTPAVFDLAIDGKPGTGRTYLGRSLARPEKMPFSMGSGRKAVDSDGVPSSGPDAPYFLVWHEKAKYAGDTTVRLKESTKKELRALGYIQ